jgi:hypothetical protein
MEVRDAANHRVVAPAGSRQRALAPSGLVIVVMGLGHVLGTDGRDWYDFWSGLGADIGGLAFIGAGVGLYRKHNCHVHGCWRIAKQQVIGTSWMVCHHHHPEGRPTAEDIVTAHAKVRVAEREALDLAARVAERHGSPDQPTESP